MSGAANGVRAIGCSILSRFPCCDCIDESLMARVPKPAKVPSVTRGASWKGPLFTEADVSGLSTIAGFPGGTLVGHARAADIIDGCFTNAAGYGLMDLAAPAPADLRDWYKHV